MAIYKTITCPIAKNRLTIFQSVSTVEVPIYTFSGNLESITPETAPYLFPDATINILPDANENTTVAFALTPNMEFSTDAGDVFFLIGQGTGDNDRALSYGTIIKNTGSGSYQAGYLYCDQFWTIVYDTIQNRIAIIRIEDGATKIVYPLYKSGSGDTISELYNFSNIGPKEVESLDISPNLPEIDDGESIQMNLTATYVDGTTQDVTNICEWGISENTIDEPVMNLYGYSISSGGLFSANKPTKGSIVIIAKFSNYSISTTAYYDNYDGVYNSGGITNGPTGGNGNYGKYETSDPITIPSGSASGNASATGMFTRYLVNSNYLSTLGDWLWAEEFGLLIAKSMISLIYGNPAESIISLMSYPFDIKSLDGVSSKQQNLYWGSHDSGLNFVALTSSAGYIDWGEITLDEYWGNFLDYEPHTKIELYLPWGTGFVSIDPGQCLPGKLRVVTNIDLSKGSCVHNVFGNNNCVIGTYAGQCSQQIPVLSNDYASKVAGVVVSATSLAVAGASGAFATNAGLNAGIKYRESNPYPIGDISEMNKYTKAKSEAISSAESSYRNTQKSATKLAAGTSVAALKRNGIIARNGSFTDGSGALGVQYPYIILSRPSQSVPKQYGHFYGYPSNIYTKLSNLKGYTEIGSIHLDGIPATEDEIDELDNILKGGVIF